MDYLKIPHLLDSMILAATAAGEAVLKIYQDDSFEVEIKSDNSPLTIADKEAHRIICEKLNTDFPSLPILSEESEEISFIIDLNLKMYFIKLEDGTFEIFLSEFSEW